MNISKIGHKFSNKILVPMAISIPMLVSCNKPANQENLDAVTGANTELVSQPDADIVEFSEKLTKRTKKFWETSLLLLLGVGTVLGLSQARAKRVENEVRQKFYENNPAIVKFESIEGKKEIAKFTKRRDQLRTYLAEILRTGLDSGNSAYRPNIDKYFENVNKFTKYYPDRKAILLLGLLPFADTRLKPEERGFVFSYIYSKATSLDSEWQWEHQFKFLDSASTYDEIIRRMMIMRSMDAQMKAEADAERAQSEAEQEQKVQRADSRKIMFSNIGGQDQAIETIKKSVLYPIKYPSAFENVNIEHGFVLYGPPGTGKTLLAEALSNEADAHFIKINGPELESKWVGETEEHWRDLFDEARENQPSIIFIDEFDSIASKRGGGDIHGDKALNQLLGLISDIKPDEKIFIIAATNRLDTIDPAFIRSGRLGTHIELKAPSTVQDIMNIFWIHAKGKNIDFDFSVYDFCLKLQKINPSGADIAYIVNNAREKAMEREHIYEKMKNGTYKDSDIKNLSVKKVDFESALEEFQNGKYQRPKIGFGK